MLDKVNHSMLISMDNPYKHPLPFFGALTPSFLSSTHTVSPSVSSLKSSCLHWQFVGLA